jgi:hypothetical protein
MKGAYTGSLFAIAFAACSGAAHAQSACQQDIQEVQRELAETSRADEQVKESVRQMLAAAGNGPDESCQTVVSQARAQLSAGEAQSRPRVEGAEAPAPQPTSPVTAAERAEASQERPQRQEDPATVRVEQPAAAIAEGQDLDQSAARALVGNDVVSREGATIGEIAGIARSRATTEVYALVDVGGFLGIGARMVPIPLDEAEIDAGGNVVTHMTREELQEIAEYDPEQYSTE